MNVRCLFSHDFVILHRFCLLKYDFGRVTISRPPFNHLYAGGCEVIQQGNIHKGA